MGKSIATHRRAIRHCKRRHCFIDLTGLVIFDGKQPMGKLAEGAAILNSINRYWFRHGRSIESRDQQALPYAYRTIRRRSPYRKLFQDQPEGFKRSKGFPAAHASGGYSLMAFYFIFYKRNKLRAYLGLALGLAVGTLFAFGQQVRGVHFASHNIWSAAICWYGSLLLYRYPFRRNVSGPLLKPI